MTKHINFTLTKATYAELTKYAQARELTATGAAKLLVLESLIAARPKAPPVRKKQPSNTWLTLHKHWTEQRGFWDVNTVKEFEAIFGEKVFNNDPNLYDDSDEDQAELEDKLFTTYKSQFNRWPHKPRRYTEEG